MTIGPHLLGRHVLHDPRSLDFPFVYGAAPSKSVFWHHYGPPLDQGDVGSCTAEALMQFLNTAPVHQRGEKLQKQAAAYSLYHDETVLEGGDVYPPGDPGGTGLMVCKAAKNRGLISSYAHIFGIDHCVSSIAITPFIVGTNWYDSMFNPDPKGVLSISGQIAGGHEYLVTGYSPKQDRWRFLNSWGTSWGDHGKFFMSTADFDRLLTEQGDATVPVK